MWRARWLDIACTIYKPCLWPCTQRQQPHQWYPRSPTAIKALPIQLTNCPSSITGHGLRQLQGCLCQALCQAAAL